MFKKINYLYRKNVTSVAGREIALYSIIAVISVIIFGGFGVVTLTSLLVRNVTHYSELRAKNDSIKKQSKEFSTFSTDLYRENLENINSFKDTLIFSGEVPANYVFQKISRISERNELFIRSSKTVEARPLKMTFSFSGNLNNVPKFLSDLENVPELIEITRVVVNEYDVLSSNATIEIIIHQGVKK